MKNYYEILEVSEKASSEVVEKAYKALVKKYHPDLQPDDKKKEAEDKIKDINEAYEILSDATKKENYDNQLKMQKIKEEQAKYAQVHRTQQNNNNNYSSANSNSPNVTQNNSNMKNRTNANKRTINTPHQQRNSSTNTNDFDKEQIRQATNRAYYDAYQKAYIDNLKSMGYEIKYEKTFKEHVKTFLAAVFTIIVVIIVCFILWHIPSVKNYLINLYNDNELVKLLVDFVYNIFSSFISLFKS